MDTIINWVTENWVGITVAYLAFHKFLVSVRDAIDKTPSTDDNWFEKTVTVMGKLGGYLLSGKRPSA